MSTSPAENHDFSALSFEQALKELEGIVRRLESGSGELDAAIADYVRGTALQRHCSQKLSDARLKVEQIVKTQDGNLTTAPFHAES